MPGRTDEAFERLWERHHRRVLAYALRRTERASAEDVVSECFLVAWRRRDELPRSELPWLLGIARHLLLNHRRGQLRSDALVAAHIALAERHQPDPAEQSHDLLHALARLGADDREALLLLAWDGLSAGEAAAVVGCSAPTFRVRLLRARRRLARQLERSDPATAPTPRPSESRA